MFLVTEAAEILLQSSSSRKPVFIVKQIHHQYLQKDYLIINSNKIIFKCHNGYSSNLRGKEGRRCLKLKNHLKQERRGKKEYSDWRKCSTWENREGFNKRIFIKYIHDTQGKEGKIWTISMVVIVIFSGEGLGKHIIWLFIWF